MRRHHNALALAVLFAASSIATRAGAATFVVETTADSGAGSLRQAITDANAASDDDTITFAIADGGIPQIVPATNLPAITNPVTIDATTQSPAGRVELSGTTTYGFQITGTGVTLRGFVVNGFTTAQVKLSGTGGNNAVEGCWLGPDATGAASASPGSTTGVIVASSGNNRIGGWDATARNVISGNGTGIYFSGTYAVPNVVVGNFIGTDASGLAALPNTGHGIESFLGSGNVIGGADAGAGNVISGNSTDGIAISGSNYEIQGNLVGVGADGTTAVPNGRHGIRVLNNAANDHVGDEAGNTVAYNKSAGVLVASNAGDGHTIRGNSIHDNGALGIDINGTGVSPNDPLDVDGGSNGSQNFPVLDAAFAGGASIDGTLDSAVSATYTIDVYASAACDSSGYGEGAEWLGSLDVATDVLGHVDFTLPLARTVAATEFVTATATDAAGSTSEFSHCAPSASPTTTSTSTTTSSTSTSTDVPTTSSTSTTDVTTSTADPTTSSTSEPTTSSTVAPDTTTSTSTTDVPSTSTTDVTTSSTSTTAPEETTTSTTDAPTTTTGPGDTTTSSTAPDTTTSTTSLAPDTTTSTTDPAATTTSTTDATTSSTSSTMPDTTTTSTTDATTTSTSTSAPDTTTTSTTLDTTTTSSSTTSSSTSSSTLASTTSSTTSTQAASTSTSTSTTAAPSTTTLAACDGDGCPDPDCGSEVAFAPLRCRLAGLTLTIDDTTALAAMRGHLDRHLVKAGILFDKADARCAAAKTGKARRTLRAARRRLGRVGKMLRSRATRRTLPSAVTAPLAAQASALGSDMRALGAGLVCR